MFDETIFVHNIFGHFYQGLLNWFSSVYYPRFTYQTIGTYNQTVEYFNKLKNEDQETNAVPLPAVSLDPSLDINLEEKIGRELWQTPYLAAGLGTRSSQPLKALLDDQEIYFNFVFTKFSGEIKMLFWFESLYEYLDFRISWILFCGGKERHIRPQFFESYVDLPQSVISSGEEISIDWSITEQTTRLNKAMDKTREIYPITIDPILKISDISDESEKHSDDDISKYKLSSTINYEIDVPTFISLRSTPIIEQIDANIAFGPFHNQYLKEVPKEIVRSSITDDDIEQKETLSYQKFEIYEFTESDDEPVEFENPFPECSHDQLILVSYNGYLNFDDDWNFNENKIQVKIEPINGEMIYIYKYQ